MAALTEQIYLNEAITNTGYEEGEAFIATTVADTFWFAFHGMSNANMYYLYIDNVAVGEIIPVFNPPTGLTGTTGNGAVNLSWNAPARAIRGYHVFRNGIQITQEIIFNRVYTDMTAPVGVPAQYYVKALYVSPSGISDPSETFTITPVFFAPVNLQVTSSATSVVLNWTAPVGSAPIGYRVYSDGNPLFTTPITALTYTDNSAVIGMAHSYHVTAVYTAPDGESSPSNSVLGEILAPPTELSASVSNPNVILNWVSPFNSRYGRDNGVITRDLIGFKIYRDAVLINTINNPDVETYTDTNLIPGTYSYTVTSYYTSGESAPAGPVSGTVTAAFFPPSNLTGEVVGATIRLTWNKPFPLLTNLTGYRVFRDGLAVSHGVVTDTVYVDSEIQFNTSYTYYIKAAYVNPNGNSEASNSWTGSVNLTHDPVTNLQNSVDGNNVNLTWTPPGGPILQDWIGYCAGTSYTAIGTNSAANFDIAARFTQTELSGIPDRWLTKVRFFPREANCVYSVKVWTGGTSPTNPGNLIVTVPVATPTIDAWNEVTLPSPIQIPSIGEMWIGVNCNAQAGYPAGCDQGPSLPYKGNLIYVNNAWDILSNLGAGLDYNWNLEGFVVNFIGRESVLSHAVANNPQADYPRIDPASFGAAPVLTSSRPAPEQNPTRNLIGYKVYRDGVNIAQINEITTNNYTDTDLPNGTYTYTVTALYSTGESVPCDPTTAVVDVYVVPTIHTTSFEVFPDFATSFGTWMTIDGDGSNTYGFTNNDFPGEASPMAFMVFNPSATTPPMTSITAHIGSKFAICVAATTPPNNDWLISPRYRLGTADNKLTFWARSLTDQYGLERFRVGISTATYPTAAQFIWLTGTSYVEAPAAWTEYVYNIPTTYNGQFVRLGIKCESNDAFAFMVDDWKMQGVNGTPNDDIVLPVAETALLGNYPNPFNPETSISYNVKEDSPVSLEIYNLKGQKIRTLVSGKVKAGSYKITWKGDDDYGRPVSSGVYLYKMTSGRYTSTQKMMLMK